MVLLEFPVTRHQRQRPGRGSPFLNMNRTLAMTVIPGMTACGKG
jgi:hypothetical protein